MKVEPGKKYGVKIPGRWNGKERTLEAEDVLGEPYFRNNETEMIPVDTKGIKIAKAKDSDKTAAVGDTQGDDDNDSK